VGKTVVSREEDALRRSLLMFVCCGTFIATALVDANFVRVIHP
jgi:hypothetical protein